MKRIILSSHVFFLIGVATLIVCSCSYTNPQSYTTDHTLEFDATETTVPEISIPFEIFETDQTNPVNNVHQATITFSTGTVQNMTKAPNVFFFRLYIPQKTVYLSINPVILPYNCDIIFSPSGSCNHGNPPDVGCLINLVALPGDGNYKLEIIYKAGVMPDPGYIHDNDNNSIRVDKFRLIAQNVTLPALPGPSGKKEIHNQIQTISAAAMPGAPNATDGAGFTF